MGKPRRTQRITHNEVKQIISTKKVGRYPCKDNLYLNITESGTVNWCIVYDIDGKRKNIGMDAYHPKTNNLALARAKCDAYRIKIKQGIDPKVEEQQELDLKRETEAHNKQLQENTFRKIAYDAYEQKRPTWNNPKHAKQWIQTLETYAFPLIGNMPIAQIDTNDIRAVLDPIWHKKPETADRVRGRIEAVMARAKVLGLRSDQNPATWRGHLKEIYPSPSEVKNAKAPSEDRHHPALPYDQISDFIKALSKSSGMGARALEICILCATRSTETLEAKWNEIDLNEGLWEIPASRMKSKKAHKIPLSDEAIALLKKVHEIRISEYVFPNLSSGNHLSQAGMSSVLKRLNKKSGWVDKQGRKITVHGFRSTFRDYIADKTNFDGAMAEHALAHKILDQQVAAYQRTTMVEKRRAMMQRYSDYACATPVAKVVSITG
jgi:integrase